MRPSYLVRDLFEDPSIIEKLNDIGFISIEGTNPDTDEKFMTLVMFEHHLKCAAGMNKVVNMNEVSNNKLLGVLSLTKDMMTEQYSPFVKAINGFGYSLLNLGVKI